MLIALNNSLAFALELGALAAFARGGWALAGPVALRILLAVVAVGVAMALWSWLAAPSSAGRLDGLPLLLFKAGIFAAAAATLGATMGPAWAVGFAAASVVQLGMALALGVL